MRPIDTLSPLRMTPAGWVGESAHLSSNLLIVVESGCLQGEVDGEPCVLQVGQGLWLASGAHRHFYCECPTETYRVRFHFEEPLPFVGSSLRFELSPTLRGLLGLLAQAYHRGDHVDTQHHLLLALLSECRHGDQHGATSSSWSPRQRRELEALIEQGLCSGLRVSDLAKAMRCSLDHFTRCFRKVYGSTPREHLIRLRMQRAAELLEEGQWRNGEIATKVGLEDVAYFCRQFKTIYGSSPQQYRRNVLL